MQIVVDWFKRTFSDPQIVIFLVLAAFIVFVFMTLGEYLTPVIASLILAYLLEGMIRPLEHWGIPRIIAVLIVFSLFLLAFMFLILGLIPLITKQIGEFIQELPNMIYSWQQQLMHLPERYPELITEAQIKGILDTLGTQLGRLGQQFLSFSLASLKSIINIVVFIVLVPIMVFFFLKDKMRILHFFNSFMPDNMGMATEIWTEVNQKIAKFIQGKIWEILIVWVMSYLTFFFLNLKFAVMLSFLVGVSVVVPYVGATAMTVPVALVAYFQWGLTSDFFYVLIAYFIIQLVDGNLLAPVLMAEIVNLHPLAIIIGILVFGGIWGFWGVIFAIPLATLVNAIIKAWPKRKLREQLEK